MMRIVMICEFFNETLEYQENLLVKYYRKHGHEVTVITSTFESVFDFVADRDEARGNARTFNHQGAKIVRLDYRYNILNRLRCYTNIEGILEVERPDLIFVHDIMLNLPEAIRYKKHHPQCRMIMDYHADYSNSGKNWVSLKILHGVIRKWFLDRARKHLHMIFPVVPASATFLREIYGVTPAEMELLPLGADTDMGHEVRESGEGRRLRISFGIPKDHTVIFTGGKLAPAKKTELLIEAFAAINRPDVHLFVVGDSSKDDQAYRSGLARQALGAANIHFTGWLSGRDIYRYLDMADLAVFPASQSILWQQSIGMGLPLVVGDAGNQDISYLNIYGNIIIMQRDECTVRGIRDVVERLIGDRQLRTGMAAGARRVADETLSWDRLILRTLQ